MHAFKISKGKIDLYLERYKAANNTSLRRLRGQMIP